MNKKKIGFQLPSQDSDTTNDDEQLSEKSGYVAKRLESLKEMVVEHVYPLYLPASTIAGADEILETIDIYETVSDFVAISLEELSLGLKAAGYQFTVIEGKVFWLLCSID